MISKDPQLKKRTDLIFTDGSFRPPDNASAAFIIIDDTTMTVTMQKRFAHRGRTINQCEFLGILAGLEHSTAEHIAIYTDSEYCKNCLTIWHHGWKKNNWIDRNGQPIKNQELIKEILEKIKTKTSVKFYKVKAHSGNKYNTVVDYLATDLTAKMVVDKSIVTGEYPIPS